MSVGRVSTNGAIVFNHAVTDINLDGIESLSIDPGVNQFIESGGGQVNPSYVAINNQEASVSASITDISSALAIIGIDGLAVKSGNTYTDCKFFLTEATDLGTRAGATSHFQVTGNKMFVIPRKLSARQGSKATLDLEFHAFYDGTNLPFVYTDSVSLPHTPSVDELFTVGPVTINNVTLNGVTGIDFDFGNQVEKLTSDGEAYPTFGSISQQSPTITITTLEAVSLSTFGFSGTAQGATASTVYFRKVDANATRVADGTAEHIKLTVNANQGMIYVGSTNTGTAGSSNETTVVITPVVGGAAITSISNASAIT